MIPMFCWQQSRNMRNSKSGRLTKRKRLRFSLYWTGYLSISNLETNPTSPIFFFRLWLFKEVWEISCQLGRAWDRSWNHETHNKVMTLAKSAYRTNLCLSKFEKCSSWPGNLKQHFQPPSPEKNKKQRQTCVIMKFNLQPYKFTCKADLPIRAGRRGFPQATFSLIPGCFFRKQN